MTTQIVLLRGINIGPNNRIAMPSLRETLAQAGFENVRTYVASGNVLVDSKLKPATVATRVHDLIAETFGLNIPVVVRSRDELAAVVEANPFRDVDCLEKLYQVSFLDREADAAKLEGFRALATGDEQVEAIGREWYAVFPDGIARSKLAAKMAAKNTGVIATARNWKTVTTLLKMANEHAD
jgi:uncharacterized protein (DUF1697 family)